MFQKLNAFENLGYGDSKSLIILSVLKATVITTAFSRKPFNLKCGIFLCFLPGVLSLKYFLFSFS